VTLGTPTMRILHFKKRHASTESALRRVLKSLAFARVFTAAGVSLIWKHPRLLSLGFKTGSDPKNFRLFLVG
jgi:hypothetical protein